MSRKFWKVMALFVLAFTSIALIGAAFGNLTSKYLHDLVGMFFGCFMGAALMDFMPSEEYKK
jgi:hypothetical protein